MVAYAAQHNIPILKNYNKAINDPYYGHKQKEAIKFEIGQLLVNNTQKEDIYLEGANLISTKQVFTLKLNTDRTLERFKARLVTRGFTQ